jgi:HK97 family phage major capsid protein
MKDRIKALYNEAGELNTRAQSLIREYDGKDMPQETANELDTLLDQVEAKLGEARRLERIASAEATLSEPQNRLGGSGALGGDAQGDAEIKAYRKGLRLGVRGLDEQERKALRADDDEAGGYLVMPQREAQNLIKFADDQVFIRQLATVEQLTEAASLGVVSLDEDLEDLDWTSELATGSESTVKPFGKRTLTPHPLAKRIKISNTLLRKASRPIETIVRERIGYKLAASQEKAYMTGNGVQRPLGLFTASDLGIPTSRDVPWTATNDKTKADSLIDLVYAIKPQYRNRATTRLILHRDFAKAIRKLRDSNDQFLWQPGLQAGQPDRVLNVAVAESEFAPNTISAGNYLALIGDLSFYWIVDSLQVQIQTLFELYSESNQRGYIVRYEGDGMPVLAEAFARLKHA